MWQQRDGRDVLLGLQPRRSAWGWKPRQSYAAGIHRKTVSVNHCSRTLTNPLQRLRGHVAALGAIGMLALAACSGSDLSSPASATASSVVVSPATPTMTVGSALPLTAQLRDRSGNTISGGTVFWSSSDTSVASVTSAGVVTAHNVGAAQIAASIQGMSAIAAVTVVPVPVASVSVAPASVSITVGATASLTAVTYDSSGSALSGRTVVWASSAPGVATVDASGHVTGVAAGTATVTATSGGVTGSAQVVVSQAPVATVSVTPSSTTAGAHATVNLTAVITDANGHALTGRVVTWTTSDASLATVVSSSGYSAVVQTANRRGTVTITATCEGKHGTASIVVQ